MANRIPRLGEPLGIVWPGALLGNRNMQWLLATRILRSFSHAVLVIAVPLYLTAAGHSSLRVGLLLSAGSLGSVGMVLAVGVLADRHGCKPILIALAGLSVIATAVFALTTNFTVLVTMAALASLGRGGAAGSGGGWGPFYPAEQPLVAASVPDRHRNAAFAAMSFVGVLAGVAGSLVAVMPDLLQARLRLSAVDSFRPLFGLLALSSLALGAFIVPIEETRTASRRPPTRLTPPTRRLVARLWLTNSVNGFVIGILGPFMTHWFAVRYGVGATEVGALYGLVNLFTAGSLLAAPAVAKRLGSVRAIATTRLAGGICLVAMASAPTFLLGAAAYSVRMVFNSISMTLRQSFVMGVSEENARGTVAALSNLPAQVTAMAAPTVAAYLLEEVSAALPLGLASAATAANAFLYWVLFRNLIPPEEAPTAEAA